MSTITKVFNVTRLIIFILFSIIQSNEAQVLLNKKDLFPGFQKPIIYPAITPDGNYMVFIADDGVTKLAYESVLKDTGWSVPKPLDFLNNLMAEDAKINIGGFSFNYNGSILYFHCNKDGNYNIYYTQKSNGNWSEIASFGAPVNTPGDEYSPTITPDGKTLFILRDKNDKKKDDACKVLVLYEKDKSGAWKGPQYLPTVFNSGCQETPFFCADNTTLLFSSKRADTTRLGQATDEDDYNIYYTKKLYGTNWYLPKYVDDLSTEFNDLSPSMEYTGKLFCSNIKNKKIKKLPQKVYSAQLPEKVKPGKTFRLSGKITDLHSKQPLEAKIIAYNAITSVIEGEFSTMDSGKYVIILNAGNDYKIDFFKDGYSHFYLNENTKSLQTYERKEQDVSLYSEVKLDLNVFDSELFYPLSPAITITDSLDQSAASFSAQEVSKGRYNCNLKIGKIYKFHFVTENFQQHDDYFDLRADVQYSQFEKDVELQVGKKQIILNVTDAESNDTLAVLVDVRNLTRNEKTTILAKRDKDGNLIVELREGDRYEIDVAKKGYTYFNTKVDVSKSGITKKLDIKLNTLTTKTKLVFGNVSFETNSAELNTNSFEELARLAKLLNDNSDIKVEISAHTDDIGSDAYNINLSFKRAQKVVDYFLAQNVPQNRLVTKGYGESMPMVPNTSDENRAKNRRVELKIIDNTTPVK
jgi:outer membrane protein OmpA-like peptidoglycan-associated protein